MPYDMKEAGLIPKGHRKIRVTEMIESKSKNGNMMFITQIEDIETRVATAVYLLNEPKKRWMLKSLLTAVGAPKVDGIFTWDVPDVIGKNCIAVVDHVEEEYINREGNTVKALKAKISEFYEDAEPVKPVNAWEEDAK